MVSAMADINRVAGQRSMGDREGELSGLEGQWKSEGEIKLAVGNLPERDI